MRGLVLNIDGQRIAGAMASGITGVIVTYKEGGSSVWYKDIGIRTRHTNATNSCQK